MHRKGSSGREENASSLSENLRQYLSKTPRIGPRRKA